MSYDNNEYSYRRSHGLHKFMNSVSTVHGLHKKSGAHYQKIFLPQKENTKMVAQTILRWWQQFFILCGEPDQTIDIYRFFHEPLVKPNYESDY